MFEDSSSMIGKIRCRYRIRYDDCTFSDWKPVPDPNHPAFGFGTEWDEDEGPCVMETDRFIEAEKELLAEYPDSKGLWSLEAYLSGYTVMMPVEHNERDLGDNRYECDIQPDIVATYCYDPKETTYILEDLRKSDVPLKKVEGVELSIKLSDYEYGRLIDRFGDDKAIAKAFLDSLDSKDDEEDRYVKFKVGVCEVPEHDRRGPLQHEFVVPMSINDFFIIQQIAYGTPRDVGDLMM